jgi:hypothetical protein
MTDDFDNSSKPDMGSAVQGLWGISKTARGLRPAAVNGLRGLGGLLARGIDELMGLNYSRFDFWRVSDFFASPSAAGFGVGGS